MALANKRTVVIITTLAVVLLFGGYIYYQSRGFIQGPHITITEPSDQSLVVHQELLHIAGTAENISHLTLNGAPISIDQYNEFNESLLLAEGFNIIEVTGTDRFNHTKTRTRYIVYESLEPPGYAHTMVATTTASTTTTTLPIE